MPETHDCKEKPPATADDFDVMIEATKEFAHSTAVLTSKVDSPSESSGGVEGGKHAGEADPYEVHCEGGDDDPLNPMSMSKARKWVIVVIVSASSLCV
jgi:hypothetical protein